MSASLPPLSWFRAFESAARHLNFTAAAQELHLTQSAVSQHVRALEERLGAALFVRKARGVALTDAGRRLLPFVSDAVGDLAAGAALFGAPGAAAAVRIACSQSFALLWLAPRLPRFAAAHPDVSLRVISTLWSDDFAVVEADVEIRYGPRALAERSGAALLREDAARPVCAPALAQGAARWPELSARPLIQTNGAGDSWGAWCARLHLAPPPSPAIAVDSHALAIELARAGAGVALAPGLVAEADLAAGRLVAPTALAAPSKDAYVLRDRSGPGREGAAARFIRWLRDEIGAGPG